MRGIGACFASSSELLLANSLINSDLVLPAAFRSALSGTVRLDIDKELIAVEDALTCQEASEPGSGSPVITAIDSPDGEVRPERLILRPFVRSGKRIFVAIAIARLVIWISGECALAIHVSLLHDALIL